MNRTFDLVLNGGSADTITGQAIERPRPLVVAQFADWFFAAGGIAGTLASGWAEDEPNWGAFSAADVVPGVGLTTADSNGAGPVSTADLFDAVDPYNGYTLVVRGTPYWEFNLTNKVDDGWTLRANEDGSIWAFSWNAGPGTYPLVDAGPGQHLVAATFMPDHFMLSVDGGDVVATPQIVPPSPVDFDWFGLWVKGGGIIADAVVYAPQDAASLKRLSAS